ncbi:MAG TPA: CvpA family protein [Rhizomicrobium sp.]|nr:CvpA family protein [Rhizomicrobium sp.]
MSFSFTVLDFLIVLVIVVSAGYAAWRGFLWETLTIFAWVAAAFGCLYFGPYIVPLIRSLVAEAWLASAIAYAAVFLAVFIPLAFMSHRFSESVKHSPIGPLDRAAGIAFGVVRGLVLVGLAYLAFTYFVPIRNQPGWMTEARLLPAVQATSEVLLTVVPDQNYYGQREREPIVIRQAPAMLGPAPAPRTERQAAPVPPTGHDPMADLIRSGGNVRKSPAPVQQNSAGATAKSYGAGDRQALDKLVETGGSGNR